ncbi:hypothetical protein D3C71_1994610 [compost metagenome]
MPTPLDLSVWMTIGRTPVTVPVRTICSRCAWSKLYTPLDALWLAQPPRTAIDVTTAAMANQRPVRGVTRGKDLI